MATSSSFPALPDAESSESASGNRWALASKKTADARINPTSSVRKTKTVVMPTAISRNPSSNTIFSLLDVRSSLQAASRSGRPRHSTRGCEGPARGGWYHNGISGEFGRLRRRKAIREAFSQPPPDHSARLARFGATPPLTGAHFRFPPDPPGLDLFGLGADPECSSAGSLRIKTVSAAKFPYCSNSVSASRSRRSSRCSSLSGGPRMAAGTRADRIGGPRHELDDPGPAPRRAAGRGQPRRSGQVEKPLAGRARLGTRAQQPDR